MRHTAARTIVMIEKFRFIWKWKITVAFEQLAKKRCSFGEKRSFQRTNFPFLQRGQGGGTPLKQQNTFLLPLLLYFLHHLNIIVLNLGSTSTSGSLLLALFAKVSISLAAVLLLMMAAGNICHNWSICIEIDPWTKEKVRVLRKKHITKAKKEEKFRDWDSYVIISYNRY